MKPEECNEHRERGNKKPFSELFASKRGRRAALENILDSDVPHSQKEDAFEKYMKREENFIVGKGFGMIVGTGIAVTPLPNELQKSLLLLSVFGGFGYIIYGFIDYNLYLRKKEKELDSGHHAYDQKSLDSY